jgi:hypothetical protein
MIVNIRQSVFFLGLLFFFYIQRINSQNYPDTTDKVLKDGRGKAFRVNA